MREEHVKVFTGTSIFVNRLKNLLGDSNIGSIVKDHVNSSQLAGFGALGNSIELFILNTDLKKATPIIEDFKKEIA
ncbi:DUF2007 domain-containing protein [Pseudotenacibaculum sp. MALMAid0570]|uniref:putative signal transducing protein n=1 Tax=Pseudotenacibaculum sp. MALMAid0570 TaxID=3143938 RepID=UPI0032DE573A